MPAFSATATATILVKLVSNCNEFQRSRLVQIPVNIINIPPTKIAIARAAGTTVIQSIDSMNVLVFYC